MVFEHVDLVIAMQDHSHKYTPLPISHVFGTRSGSSQITKVMNQLLHAVYMQFDTLFHILLTPDTVDAGCYKCMHL